MAMENVFLNQRYAMAYLTAVIVRTRICAVCITQDVGFRILCFFNNSIIFCIILDESGMCEPNQFRCDNRHCVLKSWLCDSDDDCGDGSDERGCGATAPGQDCLPTEFTCANRQCIPKSFQCDQRADCMDKSDEIGCSKYLFIYLTILIMFLTRDINEMKTANLKKIMISSNLVPTLALLKLLLLKK